MKYKNVAIFVSLAITGLLFIGLQSCSLDQPPNIVIIMADDQGYADLGCYGAEGFTTPNIDRMAAEGMRFTSFYVSQAVCSASRAALLTGCYSERVSILGALMPWAEYGLNPQETTMAEMLKSAGYATGVFGKWHLGHRDPFLPLQNGFDEYLGLPYSNDMWPVGYDGEPLTEEDPGPRPWKLKYPQLPLIDGNKKIEEIRTLDDQATLTTRYTERAVQFIQKNRDRPFFLYVPHSMPHVPLGVSDNFKGKSEQGKYGDVIMEIDWSVGEILQALKENKLDKNTLVIYLSDNGPWLNYGNHAGSAKPLREAKGTMLEGGPRVPCVMRWPDRIPKGVTCNKIAASMDLLPTIAAISGAQLAENKIDGVNIISLLENQENANPRDSYYFYYGGGLRAVRQGNWKLYFPHETRSYVGQIPGRDGFPGPTTTMEMGLELYNLEKDISEKNNVAVSNPEVVRKLKLFADEARLDLGDKLTDVVGRNIRPHGTIEESDFPFEPVNPNATKEARELLKYLYSIKGKKVLSGQHNYSSGPSASTDSVYAITGKTPVLWGGDLVGYFYPQKPITCRQDVIDEAIKQHNKGSIITMMYHQVKPFDHDSLGFSNSVKGRVTDRQWQEIVTPGTEYYDLLIEKLDTVAGYLKQLQAKKIPVLWRPYHEMNGMWFWYGDRKGPEGYVKLWKIVYDRYVNHHKLDNLIWVWNANAPRDKENSEAYDFKLYYPGSEYVDILAADIYGEYKQSHHDQLVELGKGKLIAIGECGRLPAPEKLAEINQFVWFMSWATRSTLWRNNREGAKTLYHDERVITLDEHKILFSN